MISLRSEVFQPRAVFLQRAFPFTRVRLCSHGLSTASVSFTGSVGKLRKFLSCDKSERFGSKRSRRKTAWHRTLVQFCTGIATQAVKSFLRPNLKFCQNRTSDASSARASSSSWRCTDSWFCVWKIACVWVCRCRVCVVICWVQMLFYIFGPTTTPHKLFRGGIALPRTASGDLLPGNTMRDRKFMSPILGRFAEMVSFLTTKTIYSENVQTEEETYKTTLPWLMQKSMEKDHQNQQIEQGGW